MVPLVSPFPGSRPSNRPSATIETARRSISCMPPCPPCGIVVSDYVWDATSSHIHIYTYTTTETVRWSLAACPLAPHVESTLAIMLGTLHLHVCATYTHIHVYMYVYIYVCTYIYIYTKIYICSLCVCKITLICIYMYAFAIMHKTQYFSQKLEYSILLCIRERARACVRAHVCVCGGGWGVNGWRSNACCVCACIRVYTWVSG